MKRLATLFAATIALTASSLSNANILFTWDDSSPLFVRPTDPSSTEYGYLVGTVSVDPGESLTHYSFQAPYNALGKTVAVGFAPAFGSFTTGSYHGPILQFNIYAATTLGFYGVPAPYPPFDLPFLQFKDLAHGVVSERQEFSFTVVDRDPTGNSVPEPQTLALLAAAAGSLMLRRRTLTLSGRKR